MLTTTLALYIVQSSEVVAECSAPWDKTLRDEFYREFAWYKKNNWETVIVEAVDYLDAINKYHELIDDTVAYYNML